jgi:uncharacterized protein YprB with RNaseH-like and TPR domain
VNKVLFIDIETLPALGFFWDKPWETSIIHTVKQWRVLSYSAKWLGGEQETYIDHKSDKFLLKKIWKLLDQAEIVIAHNGDSFDIKKINARFLFWDMTPPSPYRTIDTLKVARKYFGMLSNKQDDIGAYLKTGRKIKTDKDLWLDCIAGKPEALKRMAEYNAQDVVLLEANYLKFRPWIKNHVNLDSYSEYTACPKCGSDKLQKRGYQFNNTTKYARIYCKECRGWSRSPVNLQEKKPLVSI